MILLPWLVAAATTAGGGVQPFSGESVSGTIAFPREQKMSIVVRAGDRLDLRLGFDGRCDGGGLRELWMSYVRADRTLRVRNGKFAGKVRGVERGIGGRSSRVARFTWNVSGRFTDHGAAAATLSGHAFVQERGKTISRCTIARPSTARLARPAG
jgi:hypothetical protein